MKAEDLMIGNYLNYLTSENDIIPCTIDWQDLKWISEDKKGFNFVHSPIPLTESELERLGVNEKGFDKRKFCRALSKDGVKFTISNSGNVYHGKRFIPDVHTAQNIFKSLTVKKLVYVK